MLDWSFDLLSERERAVLRRLANFAGGFTLEAASSVASDEVVDEFAVIDLLSQLVGRSLVVADTSEGNARYRLLETTRAYALEKLVEAEEMDAIRRRHAQYFRDRFERAPDDWLRMPDADWHAIYPLELDNVRAALDWALGRSGEPTIAIALAGASGPVWTTLSLYNEGLQRLHAAVASVGSITLESDEARLWLWLGLLWSPAAPAQALTAFERAIGLYRRLGDALGLSHSLIRLARVLAMMGRFNQSARLLTEAYPLMEGVGLKKLLGSYFHQDGFLKLMTGDLAGARMDYEKALSLYRHTGAELDAFGMLVNFADVTWALGDLDAAMATYLEMVATLRTSSPTSRKKFLGNVLTYLAGVLTERGRFDEALAAAREGLPLANTQGFRWIVVDLLALRAALAGKIANAARMAGFADSTFAAKQASRPPNEARARNRLQALLREALTPDELERLLAEGAKMSEEETCRLALEE